MEQALLAALDVLLDINLLLGFDKAMTGFLGKGLSQDSEVQSEVPWIAFLENFVFWEEETFQSVRLMGPDTMLK